MKPRRGLAFVTDAIVIGTSFDGAVVGIVAGLALNLVPGSESGAVGPSALVGAGVGFLIGIGIVQFRRCPRRPHSLRW